MTRSAPIRRYVLLRHRDHSSSVPRWSMERIATTPPSPAAPAQPSAQPPSQESRA